MGTATVPKCHSRVTDIPDLDGHAGRLAPGPVRFVALASRVQDPAKTMNENSRKLYKLLGPSGPYLSEVKGQFGGWNGGAGNNRRIYGRLDCPNALAWIKRGHYVKKRVFFADAATAIACGYRACKICKP